MYQTVGSRISKTLLNPGDTPLIRARSGNLGNNASRYTNTRSGRTGDDRQKTFPLNLGNDRHNIVPLVWPMDGGAVNLAALDFVVCGRDQPLRTIIYFNDKCLVVIVDHQQGLETDSGGSDDFDSASDPEGSDDEHDRDNSGLQDIP